MAKSFAPKTSITKALTSSSPRLTTSPRLLLQLRLPSLPLQIVCVQFGLHRRQRRNRAGRIFDRGATRSQCMRILHQQDIRADPCDTVPTCCRHASRSSRRTRPHSPSTGSAAYWSRRRVSAYSRAISKQYRAWSSGEIICAVRPPTAIVVNHLRIELQRYLELFARILVLLLLE